MSPFVPLRLLLFLSALMLISLQSAPALDGELDYAFGEVPAGTVLERSGGQAAWLPGPGTGEIRLQSATMAEDGKGRILAMVRQSGTVLTETPCFVVRWLPDGRLDQDFGTGGTLRIDFPGTAYPMSLIPQEDGIILAVISGENNTLTILRRLENGEPDPAFGNGGQMAMPFFYPSSNRAVQAAPDGRILMSSGGGLRRVLQNGEEDKAFAGSAAGSVRNAMDDRFEILPDGGIVLVTVSGSGWNVLRFRADGSAYPDFDGAPVSFPELTLLQAVRILDDGKIAAAGVMRPVTDNSLSYVRWSADGSLDYQLTSASGNFGEPLPFKPVHGALRSDGRLYLTGSADPGYQSIAARFLPGGLPDSAFGGSGMVEVAPLNPPGVAIAILPGSNGMLYTLSGDSGRLVLCRLFDRAGPPGEMTVEYPAGTVQHHGAVVPLGQVFAGVGNGVYQVTIRNTRAGQLTGIVAEPGQSEGLTVTPLPVEPRVLLGGTRLELKFTASSPAAGLAKGSLWIKSSDPARSRFLLNFTAEVTDSEPSALQLWRKATWGSYAELSPPASDTGDLDHDGLANVMEFALGTDALKAGDVPAGELHIHDGLLEYLIIRPAAATAALIYSLEWSGETAGSWSTAGTQVTVVSTDPAAGTERVKFTAPAGTGKRFVRLKVEIRPQ